jgi:cellulose synthase/poly-beta-1,6-N-acetylglucosamine synthase-like glycosyltransferase
VIILSVVIIGIYAVLILDLFFGFNKVPEFKIQNPSPETYFSIIIPFRNEAENLPGLLKSIQQLNYPKEMFEIILVNDDSSDDFNEIITAYEQELSITLTDNIRKSGSPKKDAIETAIKKAKYDRIITTDADCKVPEQWLNNFDAFITSEQPEMIVAPVVYQTDKSFFQYFQNLDFLSLQGSTIGAFGIQKPFMCNGANLCYHKEAFYSVNGYSGNESIAGGDDIFLMEKMLKAFPGKVKYLKSKKSMVLTRPQPDLRSLKNQRIRWAAKTTSYNSTFGKAVGLIVFTTSLYLIFLFLLAAFHKIGWQHFGIVFLIKFNVDFALLYRTAGFFDQQESLNKYLVSSILHPVFIVYIAILSFFKKFDWKGREFRK